MGKNPRAAYIRINDNDIRDKRMTASQTFTQRARALVTGAGVSKAGLIATEMSAASKARYDAAIERGWLATPRWGRPEEVARVVTTMARGLLPHTVGQAIQVDGGMAINRY